jgi:hypothetical protein
VNFGLASLANFPSTDRFQEERNRRDPKARKDRYSQRQRNRHGPLYNGNEDDGRKTIALFHLTFFGD